MLAFLPSTTTPGSIHEFLTKNEFISKNKALIDWNKAKVFTIAPDQSAVVYVSGDKLYWRSVSATQPRLIGTVVDVRGWQWADTNALTDTERKKLGIGNKNPGAAGAAPLR